MRHIVDFAEVAYIDGYLLYCTSLHDGTWRVDIGGSEFEEQPIIDRNKRKAISYGRMLIDSLRSAHAATAVHPGAADSVHKAAERHKCS